MRSTIDSDRMQHVMDLVRMQLLRTQGRRASIWRRQNAAGNIGNKPVMKKMKTQKQQKLLARKLRWKLTGGPVCEAQL